jgi:competence protein ComFB
MTMINALEEVVRATHDQLLQKYTQYCSCARCRDDVALLALNQAKPRYVVGDPLGAAVTRVALSQDSAKAEMAVLVFDAMRKVAERPRHTGANPGYNRPSGGQPAQ